MSFVSDTGAPAHPKVLDALVRANEGFAPSYGADSLSQAVRDRLRAVFEAPKAEVFLVATGSAANALALACFCPPWSSVICHRDAHVEVDECGAPEFYTGGAKLIHAAGDHGRITSETLTEALGRIAQRDVHSVQRGALSLTNATEAGTVYTPDTVADLARIAHDHGMPVHMDGARLANALAATGATPAEMTWRAGIGALSLGGTKNGLLGAEAVILFDPETAWQFQLRRKRGGHLLSKYRYLAAQMLAYLDGDLWLDLARAANARAADLSARLAALPGVALTHPTEANAVFAAWPRAAHRVLHDAKAGYKLWPGGQSLDGPDDTPLSARLVCSWCTTPEDVARFAETLAAALPRS